MNDLLWEAAKVWWYERHKAGSNLDHANDPTKGCSSPGECALALAVASRLRLEWHYEHEAEVSRNS